ncbi:multiple epidermal growth factor-like domains protein 10 [Haliotis rufescens]|uniref:multiple epidermal growth factor-like domains protein 10 n=1 Tax=Haliotis rufescens TaxID=6454 RepID=UPI00201F0B1C|nr:multiple epidermal growth factor-like domains protein 10 [Haliotis rufescens]
MDWMKQLLFCSCFVLNALAASTPCSNCDGYNVTCVDGVCPPRCVNVTSSGECLQCRDSRFYGKQCEHDCPDTCLNSRCQMDNTRVVCTEGCVAGKKGDNCGVNCPTACTQCERYGDGCTGPCQNPRYYGPRCRTPCSSNCTDGCNRITGECDSCEPGYTGDKCNVTCPPNCRDGCDKDTGECGSCEPGYTGDKCNVTCTPNCRDGCDKDAGECGSCEPGYTGYKCDVTCPPNCRDGCDKDTGECDSCVSGYRGKNCNDTCPFNCSDGCDKEIGKCESCNPGNSGKYCNISCPTTCSEGCDQDGGCKETASTATLGVILVVLAVLMILLLVGLVVWRRRRRKFRHKDDHRVIVPFIPMAAQNEDTDSDMSDTDNPLYEHAGGSRSPPQVQMCPELQGEESVSYMVEEFMKLPKPNANSSHCGLLAENVFKNRYKDILPCKYYLRCYTCLLFHQTLNCFSVCLKKRNTFQNKTVSVTDSEGTVDVLYDVTVDTTRVCLAVEDEGGSDYINASYIDGYRQETQFIATQGPSSHVVLDFWRMIWQLDANKIVMLTNLLEAGFAKCDQYWPCCGMDCKTYGDVSVQCIEERVFQHYTTRRLAIWKPNTPTRVIHHLHYTSWPAYGVPEEVTSLIDFYKVVRNTDKDEGGTTVVHCSAGVGRTGTFLALVYLIEQARDDSRACVFECVQGFRMQRMNMVHTEDQYVLLYSALIGALQTRGILPDNCRPVWLQCQRCWENFRHHPVCNGVLMR